MIPLHAVQHIRRMRGGSQAHLLRASDDAYYVTKFQNNPQHVKVLANEMFATRLAQWLGLPAPRVEVIEVSDWLVSHTHDLRIEVGGCAVPCKSGRHLASLYPDAEAQVFDYLPENMFARVSNLGDFARCLVLDKWTGNSDGRQAIFIRRPRGRRYKAEFIDQGYCFNAGEWNFPDAPLRGTYPRPCVYESVTGWKCFEPALTMAEECDVIDLWLCAEPIPSEWYENDRDGLHRLVELLHQRRHLIRELITSFRESTRNPFPNWKEHAVSIAVSASPST